MLSALRRVADPAFSFFHFFFSWIRFARDEPIEDLPHLWRNLRQLPRLPLLSIKIRAEPEQDGRGSNATDRGAEDRKGYIHYLAASKPADNGSKTQDNNE